MSKTDFKTYYANPEFRKKHIAYMMERVPCPDCHFVTPRSNMTRHKRGRNHRNRMKQIENDKSKILEENLKLKAQIDRLKNHFDTLKDLLPREFESDEE